MQWQERAKCADPTVDPELFYDEYRVQDAKRMCFACPVREECDGFARQVQDMFGVLGGLTPKERNHRSRSLAVS